jgi:hypothetical protein
MGGRPVGSTNEKKKFFEQQKVAATNLITQQVKEARATGTLFSVILTRRFMTRHWSATCF